MGTHKRVYLVPDSQSSVNSVLGNETQVAKIHGLSPTGNS